MSNDDLMLAADWSDLPGDLLGLIFDEIKKNTYFLLDYIRFGAVCFEWRSFFSTQNHKEQLKLPSNLPVLLLPSPFDLGYDEDYNNHDYDDDDEDEHGYDEDYNNHDYDDDDEDEHGYDEDYNNHDFNYYHEPEHHRREYYKREWLWKGLDETRHKNTRGFYSLSERKVYRDFQLPVPYYKNCRGSSYGWLVTVDEELVQQPDGTAYYTYPVRLLNPFRSTVNNQIQLPPLTPIPELEEEPNESYYLIKAFLSANPSSLSNPAADLLVFGVYGSSKFGFCRPGDSAWTYLPLERKVGRAIEDLICYKGRFLAVVQEGLVLELEFAHDHLPEQPSGAKFVAGTPANGNICNKKYLVELGGDLLQIQRHNISSDYTTTGFRAFKLNEDADDKWVEMDTLDGHVLFLGDNSSISLSAADFPGVMPNCVYFTDDNHEAYEVDDWDGPHDIGIFNFEDKSIEFDYVPIMPPPIWIQPML